MEARETAAAVKATATAEAVVMAGQAGEMVERETTAPAAGATAAAAATAKATAVMVEVRMEVKPCPRCVRY